MTTIDATKAGLIKLGACINNSLIYACHAPRAPKLGVCSINDWKMLGIGQLQCVSFGIVCGMFYYVDNEKSLINKDDC